MQACYHDDYALWLLYGHPMRRALILSLALIACGNPSESPAGPDSDIEPDASVVDAGVPSSTLLWECLEGCNVPSPLTIQDTLIVSKESVTFTRASCPLCEALQGHLGPLSSGCSDIIGLEWSGSDMRSATLCQSVEAYAGVIEYHGYPGPLGLKSWAYTAQPPLMP